MPHGAHFFLLFGGHTSLKRLYLIEGECICTYSKSSIWTSRGHKKCLNYQMTKKELSRTVCMTAHLIGGRVERGCLALRLEQHVHGRLSCFHQCFIVRILSTASKQTAPKSLGSLASSTVCHDDAPPLPSCTDRSTGTFACGEASLYKPQVRTCNRHAVSAHCKDATTWMKAEENRTRKKSPKRREK